MRVSWTLSTSEQDALRDALGNISVRTVYWDDVNRFRERLETKGLTIIDIASLEKLQAEAGAVTCESQPRSPQ